MKKIPKIIEVGKIEDKPYLWRVRLYTEITIFLTTETLLRTLLKHHQVRYPQAFIWNTIKKTKLTEEQIFTKLIYFFSSIPYEGRYIQVDSKHLVVNVLRWVDFDSDRFKYAYCFDTVSPEGVLFQCTLKDCVSPWLEVNNKDLINVWQQ